MLPNFIIVGAAKAGTTSLYYYLKEHPEIYMSPVKETNYFSNNEFSYSIKDYENLFNELKGQKAIGEASPSYLYCEGAPERIKKLIPGCKIIIMLRNPVERIFSDFNFSKVRGLNDGTLENLLYNGAKSDNNTWYSQKIMIQKGMYYEQVKKYLDVFGAKNVHISLFEDMSSNPLGLIRNLYTFLNVSPSFMPDLDKRHNVGGNPKSYILSMLLGRPNFMKKCIRPLVHAMYRRKIRDALMSFNISDKKAVMLEETRKYLLNNYRENILLLEKLINRDLSNWLNKIDNKTFSENNSFK